MINNLNNQEIIYNLQNEAPSYNLEECCICKKEVDNISIIEHFGIRFPVCIECIGNSHNIHFKAIDDEHSIPAGNKDNCYKCNKELKDNENVYMIKSEDKSDLFAKSCYLSAKPAEEYDVCECLNYFKLKTQDKCEHCSSAGKVIYIVREYMGFTNNNDMVSPDMIIYVGYDKDKALSLNSNRTILFEVWNNEDKIFSMVKSKNEPYPDHKLTELLCRLYEVK